MTPREAATEQLERVLLLVPLAAREDGIALDELARSLGVTRERVLRDLQEVVAREYYAPPESAIDVQVLIEGDRVTLWTTGEFRRPRRFSPLEGLALALGLRLLAESADAARREDLDALAERLDRALAGSGGLPLEAAYVIDGGPEGHGLLALLREAVRDRHPVRLRYLKPDGAEPEERELHPFALVYAGGRWYALGHSVEAGAIRSFRLDRILSAAPAEGSFTVPPDFDPAAHVEGGVLFRADDAVEAVVRYSPRVARWLLERGEGEAQADGSVIGRHRVADPRWLVRHVLSYGPDAEVLDPPELREAVAGALVGAPARTGPDGA